MAVRYQDETPPKADMPPPAPREQESKSAVALSLAALVILGALAGIVALACGFASITTGVATGMVGRRGLSLTPVFTMLMAVFAAFFSVGCFWGAAKYAASQAVGRKKPGKSGYGSSRR